MRSAGLVLAAGGIEAANEVIFAPLAAKSPDANPFDLFNWRIVPATLVLALTLGLFEKVVPKFAVGLGGLVLLSALVVQVGNAPSPVENIAKVVGGK